MNAADAIRYQSGADLTLKGRWNYVDDASAPTAGDIFGASHGSAAAREKIENYKKRADLGLLVDQYIEPDFNQYLSLEGVENAAKVYVEEGTTIYPKTSINVRFLAVNTEEFGKTAWFRPQLLPYHWYEYLNLLADVPNGALVSSSFKKFNVKVGDELILRVAMQEVRVVVCDFVDYWPSFPSTKTELSGTKTNNHLIVANFGCHSQRSASRGKCDSGINKYGNQVHTLHRRVSWTGRN